MGKFPCPLCQKPLAIRTTKKDKPYLTCELDGLQMFVRYETGIRRLDEMSKRNATVLGGFVVCGTCEVAVKKSLNKIQDPFLRKAGLYCPECEELLLEAPENWRERLKD